MGLFFDRVLAWFGIKDRPERTTIPAPRRNPSWNRPFTDRTMPELPPLLDIDKTPSDRKPTLPARPRHARPRPPLHQKKGKP